MVFSHQQQFKFIGILLLSSEIPKTPASEKKKTLTASPQ